MMAGRWMSTIALTTVMSMYRMRQNIIITTTTSSSSSSSSSSIDLAGPNTTFDDEPKEPKFLTSTVYGKVRGFQRSSVYGDIIYFLGIPYAKPPLGSLRFQPPIPPDHWAEDRDAFSFGPACLQGISGHNLTGSEDCLYLNVFIPTNADISTELLSVMVWIHGGGYERGSSSWGDCSGLASQGIVVVSINYRLDVFGFLSTEDDVIPGNYGMLDQVMALKWVQQNIDFFGGDPAKVTIYGASAGATSASLLLLSPLAKGLFHRAIMGSGSSLSPWAITHPATSSKPKLVARFIGDKVGCTYSSSKEFLSCLQQVDGHVLQSANREIQRIIDSNNFVMKPRVENTFGFLPDLPIRLLAAGKFHHVSTIRGFTADEMGYVLGYPEYESIDLEGFQKTVLGTFAPSLLGSLKSFAILDKNKFVREAMRIYNVSSTSDPSFIRDQTVQLSSNLGFVGPIMNEIALISSRSLSPILGVDHYLYRFKYRPDFSSHPAWIRVSHGQDTLLIFGIDLFSPYLNITKADIAMSKTALTMWTNFVKTGNPNSPDARTTNNPGYWKPFTRPNNFIMEIDTNPILSAYNKPKITNLSLQLIQKIDTSLDFGDEWIVG